MIIQSTNSPLRILFPYSMEGITDLRVTLWENFELLKEWTKEDLEINEELVIAKFEQDETRNFPVGKAYLEIKWMDPDGVTEFAQRVVLDIVNRNDKEVMENA